MIYRDVSPQRLADILLLQYYVVHGLHRAAILEFVVDRMEKLVAHAVESDPLLLEICTQLQSHEDAVRHLSQVFWALEDVAGLTNCVEAVDSMVVESSYAASGKLSSRSFLGKMTKHYTTAFALLELDEVIELLKHIQRFRSDSEDTVFGAHEPANEPERTQIKMLEKYAVTTPELRNQLRAMAMPQNPLVHYLKYLKSLDENDYHGCFDSLHQYFDYMVSKGSKFFYHFALISKASLHEHFGEDAKALDAIDEAISVARENRDDASLTYILSWLFNFIRQKPHLWANEAYTHNSELRLLQFLVSKLQSLLLLLSAMTSQFEVETMLKSGAALNEQLESAFKAMYIAIHDHKDGFPKACALLAEVWRNVGVPHLGDAYAPALPRTPCGAVAKARAQCAVGNYPEALAECRELLAGSEYERLNLRLSTELSLVRALLVVDAGLAPRAFSTVWQQLQYAQTLGFLDLAVEAATLLVQIMRDLGSEEAEKVRENVLAQAILCGDQDQIKRLQVKGAH